MGRKKIILILLVLPFFIFMSPEEAEHSSGIMDFLGKTVNFIILFGGLTYLLYKPIRSFLEKRARDIKSSLREAADSRKDAEQRLKGIEKRLAGLEKEIEKMLKEGENEGRREKDEILLKAQKETEKTRYFAKQEIDALTRSRIRELREYSAALATALAEERIKRKMSPELQTLLINRSIERLDKLDEKPYSGQKIHSGAG